MKHFVSPSRQHGMAMIMAVLVAALAATLMAFAAWRQQVRLREAELRNDSEQAQLLVRGLITVARTALIDDFRNDTRRRGRNIDDPGELLFTHRENTEVEKGRAIGYIQDASGRFNLNDLRGESGAIEPERRELYRLLLSQLALDPALADSLCEWLDPDDESQTGAPEDMHYLGQPQPYRTANRPLADLSELLDVQGYTPEILEKLRPHVDVVPALGYNPALGNVPPLNINFATPELVSAVFGGIDIATAKGIVDQVRSEPYRDFDDLRRRLPEALRRKIDDDQALVFRLQRLLGTSSSYFYAQVAIEYGRVRWRETVLLRRLNRDNTEVVRRVRLAL